MHRHVKSNKCLAYYFCIFLSRVIIYVHKECMNMHEICVSTYFTYMYLCIGGHEYFIVSYIMIESQTEQKSKSASSQFFFFNVRVWSIYKSIFMLFIRPFMSFCSLLTDVTSFSSRTTLLDKCFCTQWGTSVFFSEERCNGVVDRDKNKSTVQQWCYALMGLRDMNMTWRLKRYHIEANFVLLLLLLL